MKKETMLECLPLEKLWFYENTKVYQWKTATAQRRSLGVGNQPQTLPANKKWAVVP